MTALEGAAFGLLHCQSHPTELPTREDVRSSAVSHVLDRIDAAFEAGMYWSNTSQPVHYGSTVRALRSPVVRFE